MENWTVIIPGITEGSITPLEALAILGFPTVLAIAVILFANAIYGYRVFKYTLAIGGAISCGVIVYLLLLFNPLEGAFFEAVNLPGIAGVAAAFLGGIIMLLLHKLAIFVTGAGAGYFFGSWLVSFLGGKMPDVEFLQSKTTAIVTSIVCALIAGILFLVLFKLIYIVLSSVVGMAAVGALIGSMITPVPNVIAVIIAAILGLVGGIFAAMKQFRDAEDGF